MVARYTVISELKIRTSLKQGILLQSIIGFPIENVLQ